MKPDFARSIQMAREVQDLWGTGDPKMSLAAALALAAIFGERQGDRLRMPVPGSEGVLVPRE